MKLKVQVNGKSVEITGKHDELALFLENLEETPMKIEKKTLGEFLRDNKNGRFFVKCNDTVMLLKGDSVEEFARQDVEYNTTKYEILSEHDVRNLKYVVITGNTNLSNNEIGSIGFVVGKPTRGTVFVYTKESTESCWTEMDEYRDATEEEIELFLEKLQEDEVVKAKEKLKNGDIIRYNGEIGMVTYVNCDGTYDIYYKNKDSHYSSSETYVSLNDLEKVEI